VIATRWANSIKGSKALELVMVANDGYLPGQGKTNFAVRVARSALQARKVAATKGSQQSLAPAFKKFKRESDVDDSTGIDSGKNKLEAKATNTTPAVNDEDENMGISIPAILSAYANRVPGLREELGDDFARGHAHASGGIVSHDAFERLWCAMCQPETANNDFGERSTKNNKSGKKGGTTQQGKGQRTLEGWMRK
jgi:hypothetical protein